MRTIAFPCRVAVLIIFLLVPALHALAAQFAAVSDRRGVDQAEVVRSIAGARVVFIGETHDDARHHQVQLELLRSLHAQPVPLAIGLEMFTSDDQSALDDWVGGKLDEETFKPVYARNWSYGWPLYRDLFLFARDNRVPLVALNIPKPTMTRLMTQGAAALPATELPPELSWELNQSQARYMATISRQVFGNAPPEKLLARLRQAQALRNSGMAWQVARYLQTHAGARVVVLAGTWHAVRNGVAEQLSAYGQFTSQVILPELPEFNLQNATIGEADFLISREPR